jgi:hypothetical protein
MTAIARRFFVRFAGAVLLLLALAVPAISAEDAFASDLKKLQCKWKATVAMDGVNSVWKLEVKANKAVITVESEDGDARFKAQMEFKLEKQGRFKAYTYFDLKLLSGGNEGETRYTGGETKSSIYKFHDDNLITVGGLRDDDDEKPRLVSWSRQ